MSKVLQQKRRHFFCLSESPKAAQTHILSSSREEGQKGLSISVSAIFQCLYERHHGEDLLRYYEGWVFALLRALKACALFPVS